MEEISNLSFLFESLSSHDNQSIQAANSKIDEMRKNYPSLLLNECSNIVINEKGSEFAILQSIILIGNILKPNGVYGSRNVSQIWLESDEEIRNNTKGALFKGLMFKNDSYRKNSAHSIISILQIEISRGLWNDFLIFFETLLNDTENYGKYAQYGAFLTLKEMFLCKMQLSVEFQYQASILSLSSAIAIITTNSLNDLKIEASECIVALMGYNPKFFENDEVLDQVVSISSQIFSIGSNPLHIISYQLFSLCFQISPIRCANEHMGEIFMMTASDLLKPEDDIRYMAIEFWTFVAHQESSYIKSLSIKSEPKYQVIEKVSAELNPVLLSYLSLVPSEEIDRFDPNAKCLAFSAQTCLQAFAEITPRSVVGSCISFAGDTIESESWEMKLAGILSLFSIKQTTNDEEKKALLMFSETIFKLCYDSNRMIREYSICLLADLVFYDRQSYSDQRELFLNACYNLINDDIVSATCSCIFLKRLVQSYSFLSNEYDIIIENIIQLLYKIEFLEQIPLARSKQLFITVVKCYPEEDLVNSSLIPLTLKLLEILELTYTGELETARSQLLQSYLCSCIIELSIKLKDCFTDILDNVMESLFNILRNRTVVINDILDTIGTILILQKENAQSFVLKLIPFLLEYIRSGIPDNIATAAPLISDVLISSPDLLEEQSLSIMEYLYSYIIDENLPKNLVPLIITAAARFIDCFSLGDYCFLFIDISYGIIQDSIKLYTQDDREYIIHVLQSSIYMSSAFVKSNRETPEILKKYKWKVFSPLSSMFKENILEHNHIRPMIKLLDIVTGSKISKHEYNVILHQEFITMLIQRSEEIASSRNDKQLMMALKKCKIECKRS